jgi:hypothetical protein
LGVDCCGVFGVVPLDVVAEGWVALVALVVAELAGVGDDDVVADDDGVDVSALVDITVVSIGAGGVSITVTGAAILAGLIGLAGLTGLDMFVTLVAAFSQVFCTSTQDPHTGCA